MSRHGRTTLADRAEVDERLCLMWPRGDDSERIAAACGRTRQWVYDRRKALGLAPRFKGKVKIRRDIAPEGSVGSAHRALREAPLPTRRSEYRRDPIAIARAEALVEDARRTLGGWTPAPREPQRTLSPVEYIDTGPSLDPSKRSWHSDVRAAAEAST